MNKMITIRATEFAEAKSGNKYLKVHGSDDKTYSIFQEGLWNLFNEGFAVELTLEKNEKGYWNVTDAKSVAQELVEKQVETIEQQPASKNRAFALSYAKDIACAKIQMQGGITPKEILNLAELFTAFLDGNSTKEALTLYSQIQKELKKEE